MFDRLGPELAERGQPGDHARPARPRPLRPPAGDAPLLDAASSPSQVVALLDHLGLEQAVVGGTSLGANVALELAVSPPERVEGMLIEMPVLDNALLAVAAIFTPILLGLRFGAPVLKLSSRAAPRGSPHQLHARHRPRLAAPATRSPPSRCSRDCCSGETAPQRESASPDRPAGPRHRPPRRIRCTPSRTRGCWSRSCPNARLIEATSILEWRIAPGAPRTTSWRSSSTRSGRHRSARAGRQRQRPQRRSCGRIGAAPWLTAGRKRGSDSARPAGTRVGRGQIGETPPVRRLRRRRADRPAGRRRHGCPDRRLGRQRQRQRRPHPPGNGLDQRLRAGYPRGGQAGSRQTDQSGEGGERSGLRAATGAQGRGPHPPPRRPRTPDTKPTRRPRATTTRSPFRTARTTTPMARTPRPSGMNIRDEVHSMEHGRIEIHYKPTCPRASSWR